jgi:hypothetical protein
MGADLPMREGRLGSPLVKFSAPAQSLKKGISLTTDLPDLGELEREVMQLVH